MSLLTIFILVLLFYFVVRPLWHVYTAVRNQQQATRDFMRSMGFEPGNGSSRPGGFGRRRRREEPKQPEPKKKKIDPNIGEYVDYEEVGTVSTYTETTADKGSSRVVVEQQIVDAEWEDIK